ncbi:hypothetical protein GGS20DRAFT_561678 [Poronia punctata]|nr:hypothetical protein GGS20DRAFT_561678 [Poronia punctata]
MTAQLCGPSGRFADVTLPAMATKAYGTSVVVVSQQFVQIVDVFALKAFIRDLIRKEMVVLSLRDAKTTITAMGIGPRDIVYEKDIRLKGMWGPVVYLKRAVLTPPFVGERIHVMLVFDVVNPSPLEMNFGTCMFEIKDGRGLALAELKGNLDMTRKRFEFTVQGTVDFNLVLMLAEEMEAESHDPLVETIGREKAGGRLVGKHCVGGVSWCDDTVKGIDVPIKNMGILFRVLNIEYPYRLDEPSLDRQTANGGFQSWAQQFRLRR